MNEKEQKVLAIIAKVSKRDAATIKPESQLVADLGIDSSKAMHLMCDVEEELKIEVPEDAIGKISTVADVLALIQVTSNV